MNVIFFLNIDHKTLDVLGKIAEFRLRLKGAVDEDSSFSPVIALFLLFLIGKNPVHRKNINAHCIRAAAEFIHVFLAAVDGIAINYPSQDVVVALINIAKRKDYVLLRKLFFGNFKKALVLIAHHANIEVIVPGNVSAVTNSTQHRSVIGKPLDVMLSAQLVDLGKDLQLSRPITLYH